MTFQQIQTYCLSKLCATEDYPFGDLPVCYKVGGKIFAQLYPDKLTLKCTRFAGELLRCQYPGVVVRGFHCPPVQQPYWNTIDLARFPSPELPGLIDLAYETVILAMSRKAQRSLLAPMLGQTVTVTIDRPLGSRHPSHPGIFYPINYGFIPDQMAPDGEEQDAYILGVDGPAETVSGTVIAVIHRFDDVEQKWVVAPPGLSFTKEQIDQAVSFQEQYFRTLILPF